MTNSTPCPNLEWKINYIQAWGCSPQAGFRGAKRQIFLEFVCSEDHLTFDFSITLSHKAILYCKYLRINTGKICKNVSFLICNVLRKFCKLCALFPKIETVVVSHRKYENLG